VAMAAGAGAMEVRAAGTAAAWAEVTAATDWLVGARVAAASVFYEEPHEQRQPWPWAPKPAGRSCPRIFGIACTSASIRACTQKRLHQRPRAAANDRITGGAGPVQQRKVLETWSPVGSQAASSTVLRNGLLENPREDETTSIAG